MHEGHPVQLSGRLLFLCADAARISAQLEGATFTLTTSGPLRDDISTDEISPLPAMVHFDAELGRHAHTGFTAGGERPIGKDALRNAGVQVLVAGQRYGKGSSREHSPVAELAAGVQLVVAQSFERIYRQNADNLGLWTSTDLRLVPRLQRGETITVDELLAGRDALAAAILRAGGLLRYGRQMELAPPAVIESRPMTLFEKIVRRHALTPLTPGQGGFVRADLRFIHEYYTGMCAHLLDQAFDGAPLLHDPASIVCFEDHLSYVHASPVHVGQGLVGGVRKLSQAHRNFVQRFGLTDHGYLQALEAGDPGNTGSQGISHALVAERYALPGQLIVGTDSHTPHSGALGCVAYGVGSTDMANAFVTGASRLTLPEVLRVDLNGTLPAGVSAKDVALHLLALPALRGGAGVGRVFEFGGPALRALATDERATLTNMTAEMGGFTGLVEPDEETLRFLRERRGLDFKLQPWMCSDEGAAYALRIDVDCSMLSPMVARPGDPGLGLPLADLAKQQGLVPAGMDEATAALFPDSFEESVLGFVPKGWKVCALDEIAIYLNGLALQKFPPDDDSWLPVIKIAQLRKGDTVGADRAGRNLKPEYIVQNGDVLFSWSGSLEVEVWCGGEGALNQHLFKVTSKTFPKWFYLRWTRHHLSHFR